MRAADGDSVGEGCKKVHFIRHGEGHHNVAQKAWYAEQGNADTVPYTVDNDPNFKYVDVSLGGVSAMQDIRIEYLHVRRGEESRCEGRIKESMGQLELGRVFYSSLSFSLSLSLSLLQI